jgi:hypothetical protein
MSERPTYSLQILLGTIAVFAVAAGAFAAPESVIAGMLVLVIGTCLPALLAVIWRSGTGYRRAFAIGAMAPSLLCSICELKELVVFAGFHQQTSPYDASGVFLVASVYHRGFVLTLTAIAVSSGLAAVGAT